MFLYNYSTIVGEGFATLGSAMPHSNLNTSRTVLTVDLSGRGISYIAPGGLDCFFNAAEVEDYYLYEDGGCAHGTVNHDSDNCSAIVLYCLQLCSYEYRLLP